MPWRPLPQIAFAICTYPFQPSSPADLPLQIGDELYIIEQGGKNGAWYRGYLVAPPSLLAGLTSTRGQTLEARVFSGIFPRACVEIREILGDSTPAGGDTGGSASPVQSNRLEQPSAGNVTSNGTGMGHDDESAKSNLSAPRKKILSAITEKSVLLQARPDSASDDERGAISDDVSNPKSPIKALEAQQEVVASALQEAKIQKPPAPVPMLKIGDETPMSKQEPLVDEIASCLREWHSTNLHQLLLNRRYELLDAMSDLVARLDNTRRLLLHKILTKQELSILRNAAVWDLVRGNKMLTGEVIVRSPKEKGRILNGNDSPIEITKLQSVMSLLQEPPVINSETKPLYHVLVNLKDLMSFKTEGTTFLLQLYTKISGEPLRALSEAFAVDPSNKAHAAKAAAQAKLRTLFTDLNSLDIGEDLSRRASLYLVVKVLSNEPSKNIARRAHAPTTAREEGPMQESGNINSTRSVSLKKTGRSSVMWGQKVGKQSTSNARNLPSRPVTGHSSNLSSSAPLVGNATNAEDQKVQKPVKRISGVGVLEIGNIVRTQREVVADVYIWSPLSQAEDPVEHLSDQIDVINELLPNFLKPHLKLSPSNRVSLQLISFTNPDSESLIKARPTLLQNIHQSRRTGFVGAPTKPRSDIYLTLSSPTLPWNAFLSHPKLGSMPLSKDIGMGNLQLTLEVRKANGDRIDNCIYPSSNSAGHTAWRTTAVERGQSWNQIIRLAVDPEDVPGSHIVMSIADAPNFPFALCWMPMWTQQAFIRDGDHSLALYKYDEYTSSMIAGKGAYLSLPWSSRQNDETVTGPLASVRLQTLLCSTKYSQDPDLLGLLKWREKTSSEITLLLARFRFVPEVEVMKLLNEVFDALFETLIEHSGNDEVEDLVFNALVTVLVLIHDRRFNVQPLVDDYAANKFIFPFATPCLIRSFTRLLNNPVDPENARRLRATSKVGGHILKFIINALQQQKEKEADIGIKTRATSFAKDLQAIFTSLDALMLIPAPILVGTKTLIVQNFHAWVPELSNVMTSDEVYSIASNFIDACSTVKDRLILYKLILIKNLSTTHLLTTPKAQAAWRTSTIRWLGPFWGKAESENPQWREQVRLCCSVVATQIEEGISDGSEHLTKLIWSYCSLSTEGHPSTDSLSLLFPAAFPFAIRSTTAHAEYDEALIEISALLAAVSNSSIGFKIDVPKVELSAFLFDTLRVYTSILECGAFPKNWLSLHIYLHNSTLKTLEKLMEILSESFLPDLDKAHEFNTDLWKTFFNTLLKLVGSDALALETFPEQKRRAAWKIAGDIREAGAELLRRGWKCIGWETSDDERRRYGVAKLGGYQVQYVPSLVGQILELCLSVHDSLRHVAVTILYNMIISEWILSQDLDVIQAEMIQCLDRLFKSKVLTDTIVQKTFISELLNLFEACSQDPNDPLPKAAESLIRTIDELLDLLEAVHTTVSTGEALQIMNTLHLMEFFRDVQKEDIFIGYVHDLARVQSNAKNFAEAGLALMMHAELYAWNPATQLPSLEDPDFPPQTSFERKEQVYFEMVKHFEDGHAWQQALGVYNELAGQYEHNTFDFAKLARTQRAMATIRDKMSKGEIQTPRYFRVLYRGLGFPLSLRDKHFVFESSPTDRLTSFIDKLQQQYPSAQILRGGAAEELEGQYLSVYPVNPQKDLLHPVNRKLKVPQSVKDYFLYSRPSNFTTTSRRQASNVGVRDQVVEKIVFTTAEAFPTILRRSEIISVDTVKLPPVQIGLERTIRKTQELLILEAEASEGGDSAFSALTEGITILVKPKSNGCAAEYWELLPDAIQGDGEETQDKSVKTSTNDLLEEALRIALIEHVLAIRRCLLLYSNPARETVRAELSKELEANFAPILAVIEAQSPSAAPPHGSQLQTSSMPGAIGFNGVMPRDSEKGPISPSGLREEATRQSHQSMRKAMISPSTDSNQIPYDPSAVNGSRMTNHRADNSGKSGDASKGSDSQVKSVRLIQSRVGSMTRRLSTLSLGIGRKSSRQNVKSPATENLAEMAEE